MRAVWIIPVSILLTGCGEEAVTVAAPAIPAPALSDLPPPYAEADLARGKDLFGKKCGACHVLIKDQGHRVGPNLHGVFERGVAKVSDYTFSPALKAYDASAWTPDLVDQWLQSPDSFVSGTSMRLNGIGDATERRDLIAHLLIASRQ